MADAGKRGILTGPETGNSMPGFSSVTDAQLLAHKESKNISLLNAPITPPRKSVAERNSQIAARTADSGFLSQNPPTESKYPNLEAFLINYEGSAEVQEASGYGSFRNGRYYKYDSLESGRPTIGTGRKLEDAEVKSGKIKLSDGTEIDYTKGITGKQNTLIYQDSVNKSEASAQRIWGDEDWTDISHGAKQASIELVFNVGATGFAEYRNFRKAVLAGDNETAAKELSRGKWMSRAVYNDKKAKGVAPPISNVRKNKKTGESEVFVRYPGQVKRWHGAAKAFFDVELGDGKKR